MPTPPVAMPQACKNLILVGYRGSGKTTLGGMIAKRMGWTFVDTDERIAADAGCDVRTLFARDGEAAFREREQRVIAEVCRGERQVIAMGGGAVLREANRSAMMVAGVCVWLKASVAELRKRLAADPAGVSTRPALTTAGVLDEIATVLEQRTPLYESVADFAIATDDHDMAALADQIIGRLPPAVSGEGAR